MVVLEWLFLCGSMNRGVLVDGAPALQFAICQISNYDRGASVATIELVQCCSAQVHGARTNTLLHLERLAKNVAGSLQTLASIRVAAGPREK